MSTATATRVAPTIFFSSGSIVKGHEPKKYFAKKDEGTANEKSVLVLEDVPVFRSGTFRDSMGYQRTWEDMHMDQMVSHHSLLAGRGIFADVPVRRGHPAFLGNPIDQVIGYITGLRAQKMTSEHDGVDYTFLLASYEIIDEDGQKKVDSGLWRNRSAEVGMYVSNNEAEFFPVLMGFAYVDIPAVEGLNTAKPSLNSKFSSKYTIISDEEALVGDKNPDGSEKTAAQKLQDSLSLQGGMHGAAPQGGQPGTAPAAVSFVVGGAMVSDHAAVQQTLVQYEATIAQLTNTVTAQTEAITSINNKARADYVTGLSTAGKIVASKVDELTAFAQGLSPEQFTTWSASFDAAPVLPLFGQHGNKDGGATFSQATTTPGGAPAAPSDVEIKKETIRFMKAGGMSVDDLKKTEAYRIVAAAEPTYQP